MAFLAMALATLLSGSTVVPAVDYAQAGNWLCRPGRKDVCAALALTVVDSRNASRVERGPNRGPDAVDCFYVYPTVSLDLGGNSDLMPDRTERDMTEAQFAPFRSVCRTFAPLYRQVTLTALRKGLGGGEIPGDFNLAYADVRAAWQRYLAHDNHGRPFVLIGHSQGSSLLKRLVTEEIDGKPVQRQLLSAILPGTAVLVPPGRDVGGDFRTIPLCRRDAQIGCVMSWASYRDTVPPPSNAVFGVSRRPGLVAGCTNPARLDGGEAPLDARLGAPWWRGGVAQYQRPATGWSVAGKPIVTRYVAVPGMLSGHCVTSAVASYLAVRVARTALSETVAGTATIGDAAYPDWGFHVVDVAIVQGDLLHRVADQYGAYRRRAR
ncbi:DUF3089 domain-containing protein [Sphingomonas sp. TREG-RG-20F-R18-01]|uniref:DUF3089 domain-containing protein n=1 Tax=Sphingomonas sp. TREG-RG-20F-R18-01 TaxID=2914982 RepID=UPI001F59288B|nr:DUF3089 domain-containing protein [Sphingomonas sp. TREG-RG-20F-R18-01]